jgi:hypothetical protein
MTIKTKKNKPSIDTFPFTKRHLKKLRNEIAIAGNFHQLMIEKNALEKKDGTKYIQKNYDVEGYKRKFLKGSYRSLRDYYDTDIPFLFWDEMLSALEKWEAKTE